MRSRWSSKQNRKAVGAALVALALLGACTDDAVPTSTSASVAPSGTAPTITSIDVSPSGTSQVILKVNATNPLGGTLRFAWTVSNGDLSTKTGPSTVWRTPTQAGTYTTTVTATNSKNEVGTGSQTFTVSADGKASAVGAFQSTAAVGNTSTTTAGTGQFNVPTQVGNGGAQPPIVAGGPGVPSFNAQPVLTPPPGNPVATPLPVPTPALPPLQPIATPTPTQPPPSLPPSPAPTPKPPPPLPGVPAPPPAIWQVVDPARVNNRQILRSIFFLPGAANDYKVGFAAGEDSTLLTSADGGANWSLKTTNLPPGLRLSDVVFNSTNNGYLAAAGGKVFKTSDGGGTWTDISLPPGGPSEVNNLVVPSDGVAMIGNGSGGLFRTENLNGTTSWTSQPTNTPPNSSSVLKAGVYPPSRRDLTIGFFVGDGIYKLDSDAVAPAPVWKKKLVVEGVAQGIDMPSDTEIWVASSASILYHSVDAGETWTTLRQLPNREHSGSVTQTSFIGIGGSYSQIRFTDAKNGFFLSGSRVIDTNDGGVSWKETDLGLFMTDFKVIRNTDATSGQAQFLGWGVTGPNIVRFTPNPNP